MAATKSSKSFSVFFVVALVLLNSIVIFYTFYVMRQSLKYRLRFSVDEKRIREILQDSVTNYLAKSNLINEKSNPEEPKKMPIVKFVPGCTWLTPRNSYSCRIRGCDYVAGDYCEFGEILFITDCKLYCRDQYGQIIILRFVHDDVGNLGDVARSRDTPPSSESSEDL